VDPVLAVATIDSRLNFSRRFAGGTLAIGGSRTQSLDKPQVSMSFPVVAFAPQPISIGEHITWSPSFNFTNATLRSGPVSGLLYRAGSSAPDTVLTDSRSTSLSISTPLRIGRWNWSNSVSIQDNPSNQRRTVTYRDPDDTTRTVTRTYTEAFSTTVDWSTSINLPVLFQGTWNLQPRVDIANTGGGALLVRNLYTGGRFVSQGKRLAYGASVSPTFFGLFGGIGPIARIRHSISPSLSWQYAPAATLPEDYAYAMQLTTRRVEARQGLSLGLSQNFEAKLRPPARPAGQDSATGPEAEGRKIKLLAIQSSGIGYDLEQAKRTGRTGWTTDAMSNTFSSDLLRGFSLSTAHRLWKGRVGYRGARLQPTLTSVSMRFSLGPSTFRALGSLLGFLGPHTPAPADTAGDLADSARAGILGANAFQRGPLATRFSAIDRLGPSGAGAGFNASLSLDIQRDLDTLLQETSPSRRTLSGNVSFSPTRNWRLSWQTQYNFTTGEFGEHVVRLDRDLHDWRASFSFVQSPNGNFLFSFIILLNDQPDIKFEYDQRNIR